MGEKSWILEPYWVIFSSSFLLWLRLIKGESIHFLQVRQHFYKAHKKKTTTTTKQLHWKWKMAKFVVQTLIATPTVDMDGRPFERIWFPTWHKLMCMSSPLPWLWGAWLSVWSEERRWVVYTCTWYMKW